MQMSQRGLLFSLLRQLLNQCPEIIPAVSPNRWEVLCLFNEDAKEWTEVELRELLRAVVAKLSDDQKVRLFIDGLDEFDGCHEELISLVRDLIFHQNVKIYVSSRPWVVFEEAFKHGPSLMLQDLTYPDVQHYVSANFQENPGFRQLQGTEPEYADQLIETVVLKASGVFLWVHLVVASLVAGMGHGDCVVDLQRRLDLLPPDLEKLYEKILLSLDPFYLEHGAQLFQLVQASYDPPSLILLYFADKEDIHRTLEYPVQPLSEEKMALQAETMRCRVNSRCEGLLEVETVQTGHAHAAESTVQYLHRTVKDYGRALMLEQGLVRQSKLILIRASGSAQVASHF